MHERGKPVRLFVRSSGKFDIVAGTQTPIQASATSYGGDQCGRQHPSDTSSGTTQAGLNLWLAALNRVSVPARLDRGRADSRASQ